MNEMINLAATQFYCFNCALEYDEVTEATKIYYNSEDNKAYPVCERCAHIMETEKFFSVFSLN